ncbi:MAG: glycosyltransferase family 2 protein [Acidobacteriota bacterium]|nr:glycosyltransferase family 2 protein [Acidobacteriota bacterium]
MNDTRDAPDDLESPSRPQAVSIIVPTYREAANIPRLAERIDATLSDSGLSWELLLIDDNSEDGSEAVAAELARRLPVRLVTRRQPPRDLSLSVIEGIRLCRFDRLVVMDADLSHPPERIADLLTALDSDCDMVVGSRYAPGGHIDRTWSRWRVLNSRLATSLALPLVTCSDPMAGFFATDRRALPDLQRLQPIGYKIALELMVRGRLRVKELPIDFRDRSLGYSKMNWRQQLNFLRHLYRLYRHRFGGPARLLCFVLVGTSGFVIDIAGYFGLQWIGLEHRLARFLSFWPAVTWNWLLNRSFTFGERHREPHVRQWGKFVASSLVGLSLNVGSYTVLTSLVDFFASRQLLALLSGVLLATLVNFLLANLYVYRRHSGTPAIGAPRK